MMTTRTSIIREVQRSPYLMHQRQSPTAFTASGLRNAMQDHFMHARKNE
jgi:hypothetical protein